MIASQLQQEFSLQPRRRRKCPISSSTYFKFHLFYDILSLLNFFFFLKSLGREVISDGQKRKEQTSLSNCGLTDKVVTGKGN